MEAANRKRRAGDFSAMDVYLPNVDKGGFPFFIAIQLSLDLHLPLLVDSALSVKAKLVEDEGRNGSVKGATNWLQAAIEIQHTQWVHFPPCHLLLFFDSI